MKQIKLILILVIIFGTLVYSEEFKEIPNVQSNINDFRHLAIPNGGVTYQQLVVASLDPGIPAQAIYQEALGYKKIAALEADYRAIKLKEEEQNGPKKINTGGKSQAELGCTSKTLKYTLTGDISDNEKAVNSEVLNLDSCKIQPQGKYIEGTNIEFLGILDNGEKIKLRYIIITKNKIIDSEEMELNKEGQKHKLINNIELQVGNSMISNLDAELMPDKLKLTFYGSSDILTETKTEITNSYPITVTINDLSLDFQYKNNEWFVCREKLGTKCSDEYKLTNTESTDVGQGFNELANNIAGKNLKQGIDIITQETFFKSNGELFITKPDTSVEVVFINGRIRFNNLIDVRGSDEIEELSQFPKYISEIDGSPAKKENIAPISYQILEIAQKPFSEDKITQISTATKESEIVKSPYFIKVYGPDKYIEGRAGSETTSRKENRLPVIFQYKNSEWYFCIATIDKDCNPNKKVNSGSNFDDWYYQIIWKLVNSDADEGSDIITKESFNTLNVDPAKKIIINNNVELVLSENKEQIIFSDNGESYYILMENNKQKIFNNAITRRVKDLASKKIAETSDNLVTFKIETSGPGRNVVFKYKFGKWYFCRNNYIGATCDTMEAVNSKNLNEEEVDDDYYRKITYNMQNKNLEQGITDIYDTIVEENEGEITIIEPLVKIKRGEKDGTNVIIFDYRGFNQGEDPYFEYHEKNKIINRITELVLKE